MRRFTPEELSAFYAAKGGISDAVSMAYATKALTQWYVLAVTALEGARGHADRPPGGGGVCLRTENGSCAQKVGP